MGRTRKEDSPGVDSATRQLDPKSKAIDKARGRQARESIKKSYKEDSESDSDVDKYVPEPEDKDFSGDEDIEPSPSESGSDWAGESSGSEYGKKKSTKGRGRGKKAAASPKKAGRGRGRGRAPAKGRASTSSKNGSKKGPAKRRRDDSDESEESEGESSGSEYGKKAAPKKRGGGGGGARGSPAKKRATASPAAVSDDSGRRSRGRASVSKSYKEVSEDDFSEEEVEVKKPTPKSKAPAKPKAKPAPKKGKAKDDSEEDDHFSDAVSGSEEEEQAEKKKTNNAPKSKAEDKTDNGNTTSKNGKGEKETDNANKDDSDNESKKSDISSKSEASVKSKDKDADATLKNRTETDYSKIDFDCDKKSPSGNAPNLRISSWNIGGIKAFIKKNGLDYIKNEDADIYCLQEIKCNEKTKPEEFQKIDGYPHLYWSFSDQPGMHGVAILSKTEPASVKYGLPIDDGDSDDVKSDKEKFGKEGRLITAEYEKFYLINAYVPNSGRAEKTEKDPKGYPPKITSGERQKFDELFRNYVKKLEETKPVIVTGDLNVAHAEIDLANPKTNERTAGFTKEEREDMSKLLEETTLFDAFRKLYPDQKGAYTFWSYMHNARQKNIGWRLDYFLLSKKLSDSLCENLMRTDVYGSDHCPIVLFLGF